MVCAVCLTMFLLPQELHYHRHLWTPLHTWPRLGGGGGVLSAVLSIFSAVSSSVTQHGAVESMPVSNSSDISVESLIGEITVSMLRPVSPTLGLTTTTFSLKQSWTLSRSTELVFISLKD